MDAVSRSIVASVAMTGTVSLRPSVEQAFPVWPVDSVAASYRSSHMLTQQGLGSIGFLCKGILVKISLLRLPTAEFIGSGFR